MHPYYHQLTEKITQAFAPTVLDVKDESYLHHSGHNAGTHFAITIVSEQFSKMSKVQRERSLHKLFSDMLAENVRLSWRLYSPVEFTSLEDVAPTPKCLGGFHK